MPDHVKPSRLLLRLEAEIAAAKTQLDADCKRAERAAYLARLGRFDETKSDLEELQDRYSNAPNARMSSWLNLVSGVVGHCTSMNPNARDKFLRAYALSSAAKLTDLQARSAAWLAHLDYLNLKIDSMARHVCESLQLAAEDDHSTRSRASLVLAQAYHLAGKLDAALPWYHQAHLHATAEGDELTISALMHNKISLYAQDLRIGGWLREEAVEDPGYALLGAESVASFDLLIGSKSLTSLVPILRAQVHTARGEYESALVLYNKHMEQAIHEGLERLQADLIADRAWCCIQCGQEQEGRADAIRAEAYIDPDGQFDDRIMAYGRLGQIASAIGDEACADRNKQLALMALAGHRELQNNILKLLSENLRDGRPSCI
jgi:tetratricopeptide (TPR) repeat protein